MRTKTMMKRKTRATTKILTVQRTKATRTKRQRIRRSQVTERYTSENQRKSVKMDKTEMEIIDALDALIQDGEAPTKPARPPPPTVGTSIQRSDRTTKRKWEMLATAPPPLKAVKRLTTKKPLPPKTAPRTNAWPTPAARKQGPAPTPPNPLPPPMPKGALPALQKP